MKNKNLVLSVVRYLGRKKSILLLLLLTSSVISAERVLAEQWIQASNGGRGSDPILAGERSYSNYYVCAGKTPNGLQAGHLAQRQLICYVAWGNKYIEFTSYYVLQGSKNLRWIDRNMADPNRVINLDPEGGIPTLICRHNNLPGKVVGGDLRNGICYTSWGNGNSSYSEFDVLERTINR
jgi:hypothetical protein